MFFFLLFCSSLALAEKRNILILDSSTSGRLVRLNVGALAGLRLRDPVLFSEGDKKIAAGRVIRVDEGSAIVAVLEKYGQEMPLLDRGYDILYGEPFDEADHLPDYVADREQETDNPANERFLEKDSQELSPELDDDNYTPEVTLRPKLPEPRTYTPHNITVGVEFFRNHNLSTPENPEIDPTKTAYTFYQGYTVRYAFTFMTHYWLRVRTPALLSAEASFGVYNINHKFSTAQGRATEIRVMPLGFHLRYLLEVNKLLRLYPYAGFQYNMVSATNGRAGNLSGLTGSRLSGGAGAQLVMSTSVDTRLEGGSNGIMAGLVVKF